MDQLQRGAHLPIRALAGELGGQGPEVDPVLVAKGIGADPVLLVVMRTPEADPEDVVRYLPDAGIGGRAHMREVDARRPAIGDAAAMRPDPAAMPRPDLLQPHLHPHPRPPQPLPQP